jgi:hypothetical protein
MWVGYLGLLAKILVGYVGRLASLDSWLLLDWLWLVWVAGYCFGRAGQLAFLGWLSWLCGPAGQFG